MRRALYPSHSWLGAGVIAAGLTATIPTAAAEAFPAIVPLASLYPAGGGDGSEGFVLRGIDASDRSGSSVSAAGDVNGDGIDDLIVGASHADPGGHFNAGESYVVFGSTQSFAPVFPLATLFPPGGDGTRGFVVTGIDPYDQSGASVSAAGDVNGDGIDDLIVGAFGFRPGGRQKPGESYVVFGSAQGFPAVFELEALYPDGGGDGSRGFVLKGIDADDYSGWSVSAAGDVNGDGINDLIVGAWRADPGGHDGAGESYVVFGSAQGFAPVVPLATLFPAGGGDGSRGFVLTGIDVGDSSGYSVSTAGDVNGDGADDLIVGAREANVGVDRQAGESYVVFGSSTQSFPAVLPLATLFPAGGGDGSRGFVLAGVDMGDYSGGSVSEAGDLNGDGIDDLIVGAFHAEADAHFGTGESYVVFGSTQRFPAVFPLATLFTDGGGDGSQGFVLAGINLSDGSGISVSAAGDANGDGIHDVIVGASNASRGGHLQVGESYVVFGSTQGFAPVFPLVTLLPAGGGDGSRGFVLTGVDTFDFSGLPVSGAGDVNGDGIDDLIVAASYRDVGGGGLVGESYVVLGRSSAQ